MNFRHGFLYWFINFSLFRLHQSLLTAYKNKYIEINSNVCISKSGGSPRPTAFQQTSKHRYNFRWLSCLSGNYSDLEKTFLWANVWKQDKGMNCMTSNLLEAAGNATSKSNRHQFCLASLVDVVLSSSCLP